MGVLSERIGKAESGPEANLMKWSFTERRSALHNSYPVILPDVGWSR
jgi:hypothetical protein